MHIPGQTDKTDHTIEVGDNHGTGQTVYSIEGVSDDDFVTKKGMMKVFGCSDRTIQRMVERFEIPRPSMIRVRKVWPAGTLKSWLIAENERLEAEAIKTAKQLNIFR